MNGMMAPCIREAGILTVFLAKASTPGPMEECIRAAGSPTTCTDLAVTPGQMEGLTLASTIRTRSMDMASMSGFTTKSIEVSGLLESRVAMVNSRGQKDR